MGSGFRRNYVEISGQSIGKPVAAQALSVVTIRDSLDWKELTAAEITARVTKNVQPGSIVLFHNAALHTPEALPAIIETLLQEGYTFVPTSGLVFGGECGVDYEMDHTGRQCRIKQ